MLIWCVTTCERKRQNWRHTVFSLRLCLSQPSFSLGYRVPLPDHQHRLQRTELLPEHTALFG